MRFTLADLKKTISRRKGEVHLTPFLLRPGEFVAQLEALIALFEAHVARERVSFPEDRPAELIGDYRLARCLVMCLTEWYEWRSPVWPEGATDAETAALAAAGIDSSSALRLALYDHVNETSGGYLASDQRDAALDAFAARLGLARSTLDDLLRLDADPQQVLERLTDVPPTPAQLAARYNQRAVETVLASASTVEWMIAPQRDGAESLGTLVKRTCFLARRMGVQYDIAFASPADDTSALPSPGGRGVGGEDGRGLRRVAERSALYAVGTDADVPKQPDTLDTIDQPLVLTLYGPQELTGAPAQYGERLARLCRALLGYRRDTARPGRAALAGDGLTGTARVYLHGRPVTFTLDDRLLRLLDSAPHARSAALSPRSAPSATGTTTSGLPSPAGRGAGGEDAYDSSLEQRLAEEWASLERERATAGWQLEREPQPILAGEVIMVPDFALRRGGRRVFLEIAGYWRPDYRERKLRKLVALGDAVPMILAAPDAARAELAPLADRLSVLWYRTYLSAPALLALLEREYNDFDARLASLDPRDIQAQVAALGRIAPDETYVLLRCYTRAELSSVVARLSDSLAASDDDHLGGSPCAPVWVEGLGLCAPAWLQSLLAELRALVARAPGSRLGLAALAGGLAQRRADLGSLAESVVEALARRAGLRVRRGSLFAAEVSLDVSTDALDSSALVPSSEMPVPPVGNPGSPKPQPRPKAKRKQSERRNTPGYTTAIMFDGIEPDESDG